MIHTHSTLRNSASILLGMSKKAFWKSLQILFGSRRHRGKKSGARIESLSPFVYLHDVLQIDLEGSITL